MPPLVVGSLLPLSQQSRGGGARALSGGAVAARIWLAGWPPSKQLDCMVAGQAAFANTASALGLAWRSSVVRKHFGPAACAPVEWPRNRESRRCNPKSPCHQRLRRTGYSASQRAKTLAHLADALPTYRTAAPWSLVSRLIRFLLCIWAV